MHEQVLAAVRTLKAQGHVTLSAFQNRAEFWNVCTRPTTARGGFGLTLEETERRFRAVERITGILPDAPEMYSLWKVLVVTHAVKGVQVHDAKLVALMTHHAVRNILTLNTDDFCVTIKSLRCPPKKFFEHRLKPETMAHLADLRHTITPSVSSRPLHAGPWSASGGPRSRPLARVF